MQMPQPDQVSLGVQAPSAINARSELSSVPFCGLSSRARSARLSLSPAGPEVAHQRGQRRLGVAEAGGGLGSRAALEQVGPKRLVAAPGGLMMTLT